MRSGRKKTVPDFFGSTALLCKKRLQAPDSAEASFFADKSRQRKPFNCSPQAASYSPFRKLHSSFFSSKSLLCARKKSRHARMPGSSVHLHTAAGSLSRS